MLAMNLENSPLIDQLDAEGKLCFKVEQLTIPGCMGLLSPLMVSKLCLCDLGRYFM